MDKVEPCPFCGCDDPRPQIDSAAYMPPNDWTVGCQCGAVIGGFPTKEWAVIAWNRRTFDLNGIPIEFARVIDIRTMENRGD